MINDSRREFFMNFFPKRKAEPSPNNIDETLVLGHLAVFPVNTKVMVKLKDLILIVESLPEGIRLRSEEGNINFKLSLNEKGLLQAHLNEEWPKTALLSIFTGKICNI